MKENLNKNQKLIRQYPFLNGILKQQMEPSALAVASEDSSSPTESLTIKVQRADGDLLYRQADNVGLGNGSAIFSTAGNRTDQVMKQGEYLFAIGPNNKILNRLDWPRNSDEARKFHNVFGQHVFWTVKSPDGMLSNCIVDKVVCLVWVTVSTWHKDTKQDTVLGSRFGECLERNIEITIFGKPVCGFKKLLDESSVWSNLRLNQRISTRAYAERDSDILQMIGCLWELCKFFQAEVWDDGMKQAYEQFKNRGASGQFGTTKILVAELCGYHRVMFENPSCWISFQLRPGAIDMYVLGQDGTLPQLRQLVRSMVLMWICDPKCHANFKSDENVSVM